MRLHTLRLAAIGPFAQPQHVDFDRLTQSGLFLFEGPTGAGKTTVLDAITFALYGEVSGEGADRSRLHSDFSAEATPMVELEFSAAGRRFKIARVPQHERPKKRGSGTTTEKHKVQFFARSQSDGWQLLSSSHAEVADLVRAELGLSRAQFTQVVLLPQGEFARFLRADDDERRHVLTRLFDAEKFDRIAAELQARAKSARATSEAQLERIRRLLAVAAEAGGASEEVTQSWVPESSTLIAELDAHQEVLVAAAAASAAELASREASQVDLAANVHTTRDRLAVLRRWQALKRDQQELEATSQQHRADVLRLEGAEAAEALRPLRDMAVDAATQVALARGEVERLLPNVTDAELSELLGGASEFEKQARQASQDAAQLSHVEDLESGIADRRTKVATELSAIESIRHRLEATRRRLAEMRERSVELTAAIQACQDVAATLPLAESDLARFRGQVAAAEEVQRLRPLVAAAASTAQQRIDEHQVAVDELQRLQEARIQGMTGELASLLVDGEPCAVCGSTEHPHPASVDDEAGRVTAVDIQQARERVTLALRARGEAEAERRSVETSLQGAVSRSGDETFAAANASCEEAESRVEVARSAEAELARLRVEHSEISDALVDADKAIAADTEDLITREAQSARDISDLEDDERRVAEAVLGFESVAARVRALNAEALAAQAVQGSLVELSSAETHRADAERTLLEHAQQAGFADPNDVNAAILPTPELDGLRTRVRDRQVRATSLAEQLSLPEFVGCADASLEVVAEAATLAEVAAQEGQAALDHAKLRHTKDSDRAARFTELSAGARVAVEAWRRSSAVDAAVVDLDKLARGQAGHRRMTLTTYVLRHWFNSVIAAANLRLATIAGGRYELRRSELATAKNERVGLGLAVMDRHTGVERSPRSLSGGETFYTSLALALGLADVVQAEAGGASLETLFVDEGFGSLDADTLDEVLDIIDGLRGRGRAVGIVSHVAELKERVPERLEIRRSRRDGPSTIRVVA